MGDPVSEVVYSSVPLSRNLDFLGDGSEVMHDFER